LFIEVHAKEVDGLIETGRLPPEARQNANALRQAVYGLFDTEFPFAKWQEKRQAEARQSKEATRREPTLPQRESCS
jgi:hypothetical protein